MGKDEGKVMLGLGGWTGRQAGEEVMLGKGEGCEGRRVMLE